MLLALRPEAGGTRVDLYAEMETDEGHPWRSTEDIRSDLGRLKAWIEEQSTG